MAAYKILNMKKPTFFFSEYFYSFLSYGTGAGAEVKKRHSREVNNLSKIPFWEFQNHGNTAKGKSIVRDRQGC